MNNFTEIDEFSNLPEDTVYSEYEDDFYTDLEEDFEKEYADLIKEKDFHFHDFGSTWKIPEQDYGYNVTQLFYSIPYYFYNTKVGFFSFTTGMIDDLFPTTYALLNHPTLSAIGDIKNKERLEKALYYSFLAGLCLAIRLENTDKHLKAYTKQMIDNLVPDGKKLINQYFADTLVKDNDNAKGFVHKLFEVWMEYVEPNWEDQNLEVYINRALEAACQLGLSMMLLKTEYEEPMFI